MSTTNLLSGALAVQLALAAVTWWPSDDTPTAPTALIEGGGNGITEVTIVAGREGAEPVSLVSTDGAWTIATAEDYPADADKVGELLDTLGAVKLRDPIATQATSHDKLKVGAESFGRKVTVKADGDELTVFVGAAASKSAYLRREGEDAVYRVDGLSEFSLKDSANSYWSTNYVEFEPAEVTTFRVTNAQGALAFERTDDRWVLTEGPEGRAADAEAVDALVDKASRVRLTEPVGVTVDPSWGIGLATVEWTVDQEGTNVPGRYRLGPETDGNAYVKSDASPFVIKAPTYRLKDILDASAETLTVEAPPAEADPAEASP